MSKVDILFIPRGHWHHVVALREPSLHLTFGFSSVTGLQVIDWLKEKWVAQESIREDVPFLQTSSEKEAYWSGLKSTLLSVIQETRLEELWVLTVRR